MIPPNFEKARVVPQEGDSPANREAQRAIAAVLMLGRQLASQLREGQRPLEQVLSKMPLKPAWQTEAKRAGLDPGELVSFAEKLLVLHRGGECVTGSGGKPEPAAPVSPTPAKKAATKRAKG